MASNQLEESFAKSVAAMEEVAILAKSRVSGYTRKDGTMVREHDDGRVSAASGGYVKPSHVNTTADEFHHLGSIPKEKRSPEEKARYAKLQSRIMKMGVHTPKHSDEYKAHLAKNGQTASPI